MTWDVLCPICCNGPKGGPHLFMSDHEPERTNHVESIASQIIAADNLLDLDVEEIVAILNESFSNFNLFSNWQPNGLGDWAGFQTCIAVGYFHRDARKYYHGDGELSWHGYYNARFMDGKDVEVFRVRDGESGHFDTIVVTNEDGVTETDVPVPVEAQMTIFCSSMGAHENPNLFLSEGCYRYLEAWVDFQSLPSRSLAFPSDPAPMTFAGELYEIINSRTQSPYPGSGVLPAIDYDGVERTCNQWQDYFAPAQKGVKYMAKGIREGLRGKDLMPAIMQDYRCWMSMRPDNWPSPQSREKLPGFTPYTLESVSFTTLFDLLPAELLLEIIRPLPLPSYLSLASTCRSLHNFFISSVFANLAMRDTIRSGHLFWILPVPSMCGEVDRAYLAAERWLSMIHSDEPRDVTKDPVSPFESHRFPSLAFVKACYESPSMTNRRRIWGIVKQFEKLWLDYRTKGWEVDRFTWNGVDIGDVWQL